MIRFLSNVNGFRKRAKSCPLRRLVIALFALIGVSVAQYGYDLYGYNIYPANGYGYNQLYSGIQQYGREYTVPRYPINGYFHPYAYTYDYLKKK
ncbi:unnamed protein product [Medioppia subpectinata]|uniref:Uncharacterized protein n=1 Tax=Medioppia subpectinata TaxID=1979941 RepID=A0A7R9KQM1_9ACAR|nr:unnamed protein product [Medioppia subpectinata]CAG2108020.1 unnamed protein product [Medioppia subpectinata]